MINAGKSLCVLASDRNIKKGRTYSVSLTRSREELADRGVMSHRKNGKSRRADSNVLDKDVGEIAARTTPEARVSEHICSEKEKKFLLGGGMVKLRENSQERWGDTKNGAQRDLAGGSMPHPTPQ